MQGKQSKLPKNTQNNFEKMKQEIKRKKQQAESPAIVDISNPAPLQIHCQGPVESGPILEATEQVLEKQTQAVDPGDNHAPGLAPDGVTLSGAVLDSFKTQKIELVIFQVGAEEFAFKLTDVKEIIRLPGITKIPNASSDIVGLCSLRAELLPVVDGRKRFGVAALENSDTSRIIVTEYFGKPLGVIVDKVTEVLRVEESAIKEPPGSIKGRDGGAVSGIMMLGDGQRMTMILDVAKIMKNDDDHNISEFQPSTVIKEVEKGTGENREEEQLVIFTIGKEEYAFNINQVKEIINLGELVKVPYAEDYIEGVLSLRNQLLAVINPGKLLYGQQRELNGYNRIMVMDMGDFAYGVMVETVSEVKSIPKSALIESGQIVGKMNSEYISGFVRMNNEKRLIMLLDPQKILSFERVFSITGDPINQTATIGTRKVDSSDCGAERQIVVFRLADGEYGININQVREINRMSEVVRLPGMPDFIDGMVNLRNEMILILNLLTLFKMPAVIKPDSAKFLVVESRKARFGLLVDSVSEVLNITRDLMVEYSSIFDQNTQPQSDQYIESIVKLNEGKRNILILNLNAILHK
jgi:purine-binding chemotaxis protein CheW